MIYWNFFIYLIIFIIIKHRWYWSGKTSSENIFPGNILIAHRGIKKKYPENTLGAAKDVEKNNLTWLELDIVTTADKVIVCSHNFDVERETDGLGYIFNWNYYDLKSLNKRTYINQELLKFFPPITKILNNISEKIGINIEIKTKNLFDLSTARALTKLLPRLTRRPFIVSSFNPIIILYFKLFFKRVPVGFLIENKNLLWLVNWLHPNFIIIRADMIDDELLDFSYKKNIDLLAWTITNIPALNWCKNKKIKGIIGDFEFL